MQVLLHLQTSTPNTRMCGPSPVGHPCDIMERLEQNLYLFWITVRRGLDGSPLSNHPRLDHVPWQSVNLRVTPFPSLIAGMLPLMYFDTRTRMPDTHAPFYVRHCSALFVRVRSYSPWVWGLSLRLGTHLLYCAHRVIDIKSTFPRSSTRRG